MPHLSWKSKLFRIMLGLFLAIPSLFYAIPLVTAQGASKLYEVETIYTAQLGVPNPGGMALVPGDERYFLWDRNTPSATITSDGKMRSRANIHDLTGDSSAAAFDAHSQQLYFLRASGSELVGIDQEEIGLPAASRQTVRRFNLNALELEDVWGMAFDPQTGRLFLLDAGKLEILVISPHPTMGFDGDAVVRNGGLSRISLAAARLTAPRGLAFHAASGNLYVGSPDQQKIVELNENGNVISVYDTSPFQLQSPSTMVFAPSSDQTDDPRKENLYLVDGGDGITAPVSAEKRFTSQALSEEGNGRILELSLAAPLALPPGTPLLSASAVRVFDTSKNAWNPSSPDPAGIAYWPRTGRLLIVDSEVEEMPNYFTGKNVFDTTLSGTLTGTCTTYDLSGRGFSDEPSGIAINPSNNRFYMTDDDSYELIEIYLGRDNTYCTADDATTIINIKTLYNIQDPEDVAYGNNTVFIAGGTYSQVYALPLGADGALGGGDDGPKSEFDTGALGFNDLEGIAYNADQNTLFIVSADSNDRYLGEITLTGQFLRAYTLSFMGSASNLRSGITYAPSSQYPGIKTIYIVSRGVDNGPNPNENDGKVWEVILGDPPPTPTLTPTFTPTSTKTPTPVFTATSTVPPQATFGDVPQTYWAWDYIERLYDSGITGGCASNPLRYCPETIVTRAQMAVFLERGIRGASYNPPPVGDSTGFIDVDITYWSAPWIKQLAADVITGGCGSGNYCPEDPVTRAQMAIFLLRSKHGASYTPPAVGSSTGFSDVPVNHWAAAWIKQLVAEGITTGCATGSYCPNAPVTRAQMAVFLVRTFNLP